MKNHDRLAAAFATLGGAFVAIVCTFSAPPAVTAATLFSDDFNDAWPPGWERKWNASTDPSNNGLRSDPEDANNLVLKLYGVQGWSASATTPVAFPEDFVVSARVWNGSEPRSDGWGRGSIGLEGGSTLFTFYADGTFPGGDPPLATFQTERWYDVRVHYRRQGSDVALNYWLDGDYVGQRFFTLTNLAAELAANRLELNGGSTALFDNVSVISVPEPANLLFIMLGAACVPWRSRRASISAR